MKKVVLSVGALIVLSLSVVGCSSGPSPKEVSQNFVKDLEKGDLKDARTYLVNQNANIQGGNEKLVDSIYSKMSVAFGDEKINGDHATVAAKVTSLDLTKIAASALQNMMGIAFASALGGGGQSSQTDTEKMAEQYMENAMNDPNVPKTTTDTQINLVKDKDGKWKIDTNNDEFVSAMIGNVDKFFGGQ